MSCIDDVLKLNIFEESSEPATPNPSNAENKEIPVPKGTSITLDTYNSALAALKKSFKEGAEIMEMLENAKVVENNDIQEEFTENAMYEAMVESYYSGPIFEAVQKENKSEIKTIACAVRKKLCKFTRQIKHILKHDSSGSESFIMYDNMIITKLYNELDTFSWQSVCLLYPTRHKTINNIIAGLEKEFAYVLGDYGFKLFKISVTTKKTKGTITANGRYASTTTTETIPTDVDELTEDEKNKTKGFFKNLLSNDLYLLIIDEKGSKSSKEIKLNIDDSDLIKLKKQINK